MRQSPDDANSPLRVCFVDNFAESSDEKPTVPKQARLLADHLARKDHQVLLVSRARRRLVRALDVPWSLVTRRREFDVACVQTYSSYGFLQALMGAATARGLGKCVVVVLRGGAIPQLIERAPRLVRALLSRADEIVAPSEYLLDAIRPLGFSGRVIPNILFLERYEFRPPLPRVRKRLFWLRAFSRNHNPSLAVRALDRLRRDDPDWRLTMAGPDLGELEGCRELVERLGLTEHVRFPGFLQKDEIVRHMANHDVFLHTSMVDNTPVTVMEAMASGLPVVATRVGGIPFLVDDGVDSTLVPPDDPGAMAREIQRLQGDPDLVRSLTSSARRKVEGFTWQAVEPLWRSVLQACR